MTEAWYVIETKLRRERDATQEIEALGFECFLPIEVRRRQDRSKKARPIIEYEVAMFPRYIFPRFDMAKPCGWQAIGRLQSVRGWLKAACNEVPRPIRDKTFIDRVKLEQIALRAALNNDQAVKLAPLPDGVRVTITEGPFATLGGIVNMSVGDRVKLLIDAAGFSELEIGRASLAVA